MKTAIVFLAIALQVAFACEGHGSHGGYGYNYPSWGYGYGGYPYGGYGAGYGYGLGGYLSGYTEGCSGCGGCGGCGGYGLGGYGGLYGGYGGGYGCGCCLPPPRPCEEIVIKEKPGEIRKVVVEEEFLVPVRKQSRPRPLEVVVDAPCDNCLPKAPCSRPCGGPCGGYY